MTTKQLNVSGPRNFKEKIELLKRKEAACTASFAAAIRDAREICKIAESCDVNCLKSGTSTRWSKNSSSYDASSGNESNFLQLLTGSTEKTNCCEAKAHHDQPVNCTTTGSFHPAISTMESSINSVAPRVHVTNTIQPSHRFARTDQRLCSSYTNVNESFRNMGRYESEQVGPQQPRIPMSKHYDHNSLMPVASAKSYTSLNTAYSSTNSKPYTQHPLSQSHSHVPMDRSRFDTRTVSASPFIPGGGHYQPSPMTHTAPSSYVTPYQPAGHGPPYNFRPQYQQCGLVRPPPTYGVECRRVSSDSSIRQSLITAQLSARPLDSSSLHPSYPPCKPGSRHYVPNSEDHVLPAKRPYTLTTGMDVTPMAAQGRQYTELQSPSMSNVSGARFNPSHFTNQPDAFANPVLSDASSSRSDFSIHKNPATGSSNVLSALSAPNIPIHDLTPQHGESSLTTSGVSGTDAAATAVKVSSAGPEAADLDRYLRIPGALLDGDESGDWVGRRDSCTMTAEVLSALSTDVCETQSTNPAAPSDSRYISFPPSFTGDYDQANPSFTPTNAAPPAQVTTTCCVQDVANRLGISITSNDYQLLTNPHLSNYVTDETTEAQLLL